MQCEQRRHLGQCDDHISDIVIELSISPLEKVQSVHCIMYAKLNHIQNLGNIL